mgnify:CR=1 FL=1
MWLTCLIKQIQVLDLLNLQIMENLIQKIITIYNGNLTYFNLYFVYVLTIFQNIHKCFDTLIILAHLKDKLLEKEGKEMTERGIDLIGKSAAILSANVDAIGYMYREDNKTLVNFKPSESVTCGSRCDHLKDAKITLIESDKDGNLTINWDKIFVK